MKEEQESRFLWSQPNSGSIIQIEQLQCADCAAQKKYCVSECEHYSCKPDGILDKTMKCKYYKQI